MVANLARMPHLLIAGTTGSGKSVAINTMILSLLYKLGPDECRLIMIDPKMLELSVYDGIPHLLSPVVTDPKKAVVALKWTVAEMEERYRKMSKMGVRNIDGYNARVKDALDKGEAFTRTVQTGFDEETGEPVFETESFQPEPMPFIVVIVDEMADLMMVAGKEIEACIQRLAQMARASGIHLIMATQRPSVDVITGTIKANFPTRISFQVTSKIDSRTILGEMGAEQLLGQGDMLYMAGGGRITRVHGPFVSDEEVEEVVRHLKTMGAPSYDAGIMDGPDADEESEIDLVLGLGGNTQSDDALYDQAVAIVAKDRKCSTSYIQRKLSVGYNKAAKLVEMMEEQGVVSHGQPRRQARGAGAGAVMLRQSRSATARQRRDDGGARRVSRPRRQARGAGAGAVSREGSSKRRRSLATASSLSRVQMKVPEPAGRRRAGTRPRTRGRAQKPGCSISRRTSSSRATGATGRRAGSEPGSSRSDPSAISATTRA